MAADGRPGTDGTTGTIADASFATDPFASRYLGDTTVSAAAAGMSKYEARLGSPFIKSTRITVTVR
jgi:hypothetical protein